ncbi:ProQ/FINO family protein [Rosenbergiella australiborealis]|uniref:ProQ/FINO family protein n=1 Tax=Rosenbergiella australiborealis TaxID=1544696 RepID=UPI001F4D4B37|nr:ProQ/FinO family protein [Rosenbergiella australiborealis]
MTDNNEAKRPVLSLKRKLTPKPAEAEKTPQKPVQVAKKSNKRARKNARHKHNQMLRLISIFPALLSEEEAKPFKVGILEDMAKYIADNQITFGIGQVKSALARYTSHYRYQKALAAGGDRYDLDGNPCGEVTPEQQAAAKEKTKAIKAVYNGKG